MSSFFSVGQPIMQRVPKRQIRCHGPLLRFAKTLPPNHIGRVMKEGAGLRGEGEEAVGEAQEGLGICYRLQLLFSWTWQGHPMSYFTRSTSPTLRLAYSSSTTCSIFCRQVGHSFGGRTKTMFAHRRQNPPWPQESSTHVGRASQQMMHVRSSVASVRPVGTLSSCLSPLAGFSSQLRSCPPGVSLCSTMFGRSRSASPPPTPLTSSGSVAKGLPPSSASAEPAHSSEPGPAGPAPRPCSMSPPPVGTTWVPSPSRVMMR
mmetsp:Transcript_7129/g.17123  ORF Transcript_7129/g.17123 Transcript_7129/m.17123 type:complete len:260 (-) Transcript_7129:1899-2678(-)